MHTQTQELTRRTFETTVEMNAPVEAVWKALTEAAELTRWFPTYAEVKPGPDGSVFISWGEDFPWRCRIGAWEPSRHVQWKFEESPDGKQPPVPLTVDFHLESRGGKTVLRLVHTGMGKEALWDNYFDGISRGWKFELRGLRHYVEIHRGKDRRVIWVRRNLTLSPEETTRRLIGPQGSVLRGQVDGLKEGDAYDLEVVGTGERISGVVQGNALPHMFAGTVTQWNKSLLRVVTETCGGKWQTWIWVSTYAVPDKRFEEIKQGFESAMSKALAA